MGWNCQNFLIGDFSVACIYHFSPRFCESFSVFDAQKFEIESSQGRKVNVSSTNSEQCKLCINSPLYIDARLLWK